MPKMKYRDIAEDVESTRSRAKRFLEAKYFGLFLNAYKFDNLDAKKTRFLLKKAWKVGTWAMFIAEGTKTDASLDDIISNKTASSLSVGKDYPNGLPVIVQYGAVQYDAEDEPSVVTLINSRGASFIPTQPQIVNKDVVIGWAHTSHAGVRELVMWYIDRIVDVEMTIDTNIFVHKLPRLVICSPEDRARVNDLMNKIEAGEHMLFMDATDWQAIKNVLDTGAGTFIIDKLYSYKQNLDNELLSFLGINNVSITKKERLITDEAESNDQLINDSSACFLDSLKNFCEDVSEILGYPLSVEAKSAPVMGDIENPDEEGDKEDEKDRV